MLILKFYLEIVSLLSTPDGFQYGYKKASEDIQGKPFILSSGYQRRNSAYSTR